MSTTRQEKISRLLEKDLADIFRLENGSLAPGKMISVTKVRITPDLGDVKVYLSLFPSNDTEPILKNIKLNSWKIKNELVKRIRHQVKIMPELHFYLDDSLDYIDHIDQLLKP